ncbi:cytochrome c biogenesis protein CcsA [Desulfoluna spongiiphila]|uniref:Cytochrome c-type biogenesis protein CcsB n=1 Tax=Desulfoluna spongiiphila TaxID=419481 RepID=A0A1G5JE36_9BACT|nr:cytochrome c biogenesis protein CcsA [Desulfoluna spongiiphila]SCY86602.1 cytochrome c-type biogenesis protein CcsB [Desulfoluna spongiiphila]VVS93093.1 cytochrome c assembly protein [Desulfoluna spongiiphila]
MMDILTAAFYLASAVAYLLYLFFQKEKVQEAGYLLFGAGFAVHTISLVVTSVQTGYLPVHNLRETLGLAAWAVALVFLFLRARYRIKVMGVYAAPLALLAYTAALRVPDLPPTQPEAVYANFWFFAHVITIFVGEAALAMACGAGILYILQENAIKEKKRGFFYRRLPSLEQLDDMGYASIIVGFSALTLGLVTGLLYSKIIWHRFISWDPKEVWSGISWVIYAVLLHERLVGGMRGRKAAWLAIAGFAVLLFTLFGVNFFMEGHHGEFTRFR